MVIWADGMTDWDAFLCGILFLFLSLAGVYLMLLRRKGATYTLIFSGGKLRIFFCKEYIGSERLVDFLQKQYFFEKNA